ncbi:MAG: protein-glutamate O-methyltransferase CheR [Chloroflexi bacterium]|nr:protein-glutamate O-methyltransferase CheR [Chloroflexota bacterium]
MMDMDYTFFQKKVLDLTGIDLASYKSEQMKRRLNTIMARSGSRNLFDYYRLISADADRRQEFRDFVTINVSEFFRIPDKFEYLRRQILPGLLAKNRRLKVWSAGCSNGSEPYSLSIVLSELAPLGQWKILATDIDSTILDRARIGVYPSADLKNLKPELLTKYFVKVGGQFQVIDQVKNKVQFKVHDLLRQHYEADLDLIVCRHVVIYFTDDAKDEIYRKFYQSLRPGGVLFIGGTELIRRPQDVGYESLAVSFYRKAAH